jgi:hypothetical protein
MGESGGGTFLGIVVVILVILVQLYFWYPVGNETAIQDNKAVNENTCPPEDNVAATKKLSSADMSSKKDRAITDTKTQMEPDTRGGSCFDGNGRASTTTSQKKKEKDDDNDDSDKFPDHPDNFEKDKADSESFFRMNESNNNNNWRCACEGGFLPPGMLKSFGSAEAMMRLGTGQCYHKQM